MKTNTKIKNLIMRWLIAVSLAISFSLTTWAQSNSSLTSFNRLDVSGAVSITLVQDSHNYIEPSVEALLADDVKAEVKGEVLMIKPFGNSKNHEKPINIKLTYNQLNAIEASGAVRISSSNVLKSNMLELDFSGASKAEIETSVVTLNLDFSGATDVKLSGNTDVMQLEASGACKLDALDLMVKQADLECSGACHIDVNVAEKLTIDASGASMVSYKGSPSVADKKSSGASQIRAL